MKVKVIKRFYDKTNNLALCEVNKEIEVTPERAKELISKGFTNEKCPRCGNNIVVEDIGNSYTVKCSSKECISLEFRGI